MAFTLVDIENIIAGLRRRLRLLEIQGNTGVIKTGLAIDRPTPTVSTGTTIAYYATDTKVFSVWNSDIAAWDEVTLT